MLSLQSQISWLGRTQWTLLAATALLAGGFYLFAYRPQTARLANLASQIATNRDELAECMVQTKTLSTVAADVERLRSRLKEYKSIPAQRELPRVIVDIGELQQTSMLKKPDMRQGATVRGERLNQNPIALSFEGDFVNVFSFLRQVEQLQQLTRVPDIKIKSKDKQGQVRVDMTMNIYCAVD